MHKFFLDAAAQETKRSLKIIAIPQNNIYSATIKAAMLVMSTIIKKFLGIAIKFFIFFLVVTFLTFLLINSAEMGETKIFLFRSNKDGPNII